MSPIGGFFELEIIKNREYFPNSIKINTARNALEYIIISQKYNKIFLPYYICDCMLQPLVRQKIEYEFYPITKAFLPVLYHDLQEDEALLYVNYFGICTEQASKVVAEYRNVIIDNSQAFFSKPFDGIDTLYSPRKFFGVPDGAYLFTDQPLNSELEQDISEDRFKHLIKRIERGPEEAYKFFQENEKQLDNQPIKRMSKITSRLLSAIDYESAKEIRNSNFLFLHDRLKKYNQLYINLDSLDGPMVYPFLNDVGGLREKLIQEKIFVATYWHEVVKRVKKNSFEYLLTDKLLPLPIDQRYTKDEMGIVLSFVMGGINNV